MVLLSGDDQDGVVGAALGEPLVVLVVDASGNPLAGTPVTWTFGSGKGSGQGNASRATIVTQTTDDEGLVSVDWELGTTAGPQLAWAEVGTASTVTDQDVGPALAPPDNRGNQDHGKKVGFRAKSNPSEPAEIVVSQTSLTLEVGETVTLTAVVLDQYGNEIPDAVVEWSSSDPSIVSVESPTAASGTSFAALPGRFDEPDASLDSQE